VLQRADVQAQHAQDRQWIIGGTGVGQMLGLRNGQLQSGQACRDGLPLAGAERQLGVHAGRWG